MELVEIGAPDVKWDQPLAAFEIAHLHEMKASAQINRLVEISIQQRDHACNAFLQWFVQNQVEVESMVGSIVEKLRLVGNDQYGLFLLDRDMG